MGSRLVASELISDLITSTAWSTDFWSIGIIGVDVLVTVCELIDREFNANVDVGTALTSSRCSSAALRL